MGGEVEGHDQSDPKADEKRHVVGKPRDASIVEEVPSEDENEGLPPEAVNVGRGLPEPVNESALVVVIHQANLSLGLEFPEVRGPRTSGPEVSGHRTVEGKLSFFR